MKVYNKLVRDRIPEIIEESGKKANYRVLSQEEYRQALKDKLLEEVLELLAAKTKEEMIEELADIDEVIRTMKIVFNISRTEVDFFAMHKANEKGEFEKRYFLESVED